jgi:hypothetical protein
MKIGENWDVHAPWAQLVCTTEIPEDKLVKFYAISNEVLDESKATDDNYGSGVIPLPWRISFDKFGKYGVTDYIIPGGPHTHWHSRIVDAWVVSQKENDYIPVHAHDKGDNQTESSKISGILYLKVPEQIERNANDIAIRGGRDGQIVFTGMGGVDPFSTTNAFNIIPEAGRLYLFPSSLNHQVYPFKGAGERRGISFNIDVISKEQMELLQLAHDQNSQEQNEAE